MSVTTDIAAVKAEAANLTALWATATTQYEARKASIAAKIDSYVAAHQGAADNHNAEIVAATALKATLVPVVAAAETVGADIESFVLTQPWYQRLVAFFKRNWRWLAYGGGLSLIGYIAVHVHK